jgi:hypothetical protein
MRSICNTAALVLLSLILCTGAAVAQPTQLSSGGSVNEFATFVQVQETGLRVWLDDVGPNTEPWVVQSGVEDVATVPWKADAVCNSRLKTFSVRHPSGENSTTTTSQKLLSSTKTLHGTGSLQSFPLELIRNRCLDIANGPHGGKFRTTADTPDERAQKLTELGAFFNEHGWAETIIEGVKHQSATLFLTAMCSGASGQPITFQVPDKPIFPAVAFRCCKVGEDCGGF